MSTSNYEFPTVQISGNVFRDTMSNAFEAAVTVNASDQRPPNQFPWMTQLYENSSGTTRLDVLVPGPQGLDDATWNTLIPDVTVPNGGFLFSTEDNLIEGDNDYTGQNDFRSGSIQVGNTDIGNLSQLPMNVRSYIQSTRQDYVYYTFAPFTLPSITWTDISAQAQLVESDLTNATYNNGVYTVGETGWYEIHVEYYLTSTQVLKAVALNFFDIDIVQQQILRIIRTSLSGAVTGNYLFKKRFEAGTSLKPNFYVQATNNAPVDISNFFISIRHVPPFLTGI